MSAASYGLQFICDLCRNTAPGPAVLPGDEPISWDNAPLPDGWTAITPMLSIRVTDAYGAAVNHLCPACSALPISEIAARMIAVVKTTVVS